MSQMPANPFQPSSVRDRRVDDNHDVIAHEAAPPLDILLANSHRRVPLAVTNLAIHLKYQHLIDLMHSIIPKPI